MPEYISKYFTREEVTCRCGCQWDTVSQTTLNRADQYREHYGKPIKPSSVCRCVDHNKAEGGAKASQHLPHPRGKLANGVMVFESKAMDLPVSDPTAAGKWFEANAPEISFIVYKTFIHIDCRERRYRRWLRIS